MRRFSVKPIKTVTSSRCFHLQNIPQLWPMSIHSSLDMNIYAFVSPNILLLFSSPQSTDPHETNSSLSRTLLPDLLSRSHRLTPITAVLTSPCTDFLLTSGYENSTMILTWSGTCILDRFCVLLLSCQVAEGLFLTVPHMARRSRLKVISLVWHSCNNISL